MEWTDFGGLSSTYPRRNRTVKGPESRGYSDAKTSRDIDVIGRLPEPYRLLEPFDTTY